MTSRYLRLFLGAAWLASAASAFAANSIQIVSQPGSDVGQGRSFRWTSDEATFNNIVGTSPYAYYVYIRNGNSSVDLSLKPPQGSQLAQGTYEAVDLSDRPAGMGELSVNLGGASCSARGRFTIHEIAYAADSSITKLAVDFEYHCSFQEPGAYGALRINSDVPYVFTPSPFINPAFIRIFTPAGSAPGYGQDKLVTRPDFYFVARPNSQVEGAEIYPVPVPPGTWPGIRITFAPPTGRTLSVGTYENTERFAQSSTRPKPLLSVEGVACDQESGRFTILEIQPGLLNVVYDKLAADFEFRCDATGPTYYGAVRYGSSIPYVPPSSPPPPASSTDKVWQGGALWSSGAAWVGGHAPVAGDRLIFPGTATSAESGNDLPSVAFDGITVGNPVGHTFQGQQHLLAGSHPITIDAAAGPVSFFAPVRLTGGDATISAANSGAPFKPALQIGGYQLPLTVGPGTVRIEAPSGDVLIPADIVEQGTSSWVFAGRRIVLSGANAISGTVEVKSGVLRLESQSALGSSSAGTIVTGGRLEFGSLPGGQYWDFSEPLDLRGVSDPVEGSFAPFGIVRGPISITGTQTIRTYSVSLYSAISGTGKLRLSADSSIYLNSAAHSFTGGLEVAKGQVTLTSTDAIPDANTVEVDAGATLEVGQLGYPGISDTVRSLTCAGTLVMHLGRSQLRVLQASSLSGCTFSYWIPPDLSPAADITLIRNDSGVPVSGTFKSMPEGTAFTINGAKMYMSYRAGNGNDVALVLQSPPPIPARLDIVSGSPQAVPAGISGNDIPFVVRAFDASGQPVANVRVRFETPPNCIRFDNLGTVRDAFTNADGVAKSPFVYAGSYDAKLCTPFATVPDSNLRVDFAIELYFQSEVVLEPIPAVVATIVNQPFSFTVRPRTKNGFTLPKSYYISAAVETTGSAGATNVPAYIYTDANGRATGTGVANGSPGTYRIAVWHSYREEPNAGQIRVEQSAAAPPVAGQQVSGASPAGGLITMSLASSRSSCAFTRSTFIDPRVALIPAAQTAPAPLAFPHGFVDYTVENCGAGSAVTFTIEYPQSLPASSVYWKYGPTPDNASPHWYPFPARVDGNKIIFTVVDGGLGDDDLTANGSISDPGGVAVAGGTTQDLWWSGPQENGWGMSIIQHRDTLFANMYVYDNAGKPIWYVMPSGTWNGAHTSFTGALYLPHGAPYFAYDASQHGVGPQIGTATITFTDANNATFDYTINGVTGHKVITRILFGPPDNAARNPVADLWWAGVTQNGWGLSILQQYSTIFSLWFTYDSTGAATWYVMPGGDWLDNSNYRGKVYRAVGPAWLGVPYDVTKHQTIEVGTFNLRFSGEAATFDYTVDGHTGSIPISRIPF